MDLVEMTSFLCESLKRRFYVVYFDEISIVRQRSTLWDQNWGSYGTKYSPIGPMLKMLVCEP